MLQESWVQGVWQAMGGGGSDIVKATDHKFLSHVFPVFLNQIVCVSQLPKADKAAIRKMVEDNGECYYIASVFLIL